MTGLLMPIYLGSMISMYNMSTWPGKLIIIILFITSIGAWYVMYVKFVQLSRAQKSSARFLSLFRNKPNPFSQGQRVLQSPLNTLYEAGCKSISSEGGKELSYHQIEQVRAIIDRNMADEALKLEDGMGWLATAISGGPLLGLLGTVWGVMDAFGAMATSGAASLASMAPGIAGALLTTVIGLLVALPSSVGYNVLATKIRHLSVEMDNFSQEFMVSVQLHFSIKEK